MCCHDSILTTLGVLDAVVVVVAGAAITFHLFVCVDVFIESCATIENERDTATRFHQSSTHVNFSPRPSSASASSGKAIAALLDCRLASSNTARYYSTDSTTAKAP